eukprot:scaffold50225_cov39-Attheya_sp.AAC.1
MAGLQRLRPVTMKDFETAVGKLKRSVSEKGREVNWQVYGNGTMNMVKSKTRTRKIIYLN